MRAVICEEFGPADQLKFKDVPTPKAGKGELLLDVKIAACNFPDLLVIQGKYQIVTQPPFTPGGEGCGVVREIGEGVTAFSVGDRVSFYSLTGAFAEQIVVPAAYSAKVIDELPDEVAASIGVFSTVYHGFKQRGNLQPGEHVLVLGAAGGIGTAAIQVAKAMGAKVIAAATTEKELEACRALGADWTFNYKNQDLKTALKESTGRNSVDVIIDPIGGDFTETAFRCMAPKGRHLVIGFVAGIPKIALNLVMLKQASIVGVLWNNWLMVNHAEHMQNTQELCQLFIDDKIHIHIHKTFALEDYMDAFNLIEKREVIGKILIRP
jgi:NADPH2:quinone reductase